MKSLHTLLIFSFFLVFAASPLLTAYQLNSSSSDVSFEINNMGVAVSGSLSNPSGTVIFDPSDLAGSSINTSVKVNTVDTGIELRDKDLLKEEYFDVAKYPSISFVSSSISKNGSGYQAKGTLSIKGKSKEINVPFTVENNVFKGKFNIDRLDFHVGEDSWILGDEVRIKFTLPVTAK
ncbi:MAG: YceI family protein [Bacteroidota bacterium]